MARRRDTVDRRRMRRAVIAAVLLHLCLVLVVELVPSGRRAESYGVDRLTVELEPPGSVAADDGAAEPAPPEPSGPQAAELERGPSAENVSENLPERDPERVEAPLVPPESGAGHATEAEPAGTAHDNDRVARTGQDDVARNESADAAAATDRTAERVRRTGPLSIGADVDLVLADLHRRLQDQLIYPMSARRRAVQGVVTVRILVEPDGRLGRYEVETSSGHSILDQAALDSLQRVFPIAHRAGRPLLLTVRIEYSLT